MMTIRNFRAVVVGFMAGVFVTCLAVVVLGFSTALGAAVAPSTKLPCPSSIYPPAQRHGIDLEQLRINREGCMIARPI
jgi:hypothetical protein